MRTFAVAMLLAATSAFEQFEGTPVAEKLLQTRFATDSMLNDNDLDSISAISTHNGWEAARDTSSADEELIQLQGVPVGEKLLMTRFAEGLDDAEIVDSESYAQAETQLPTCDRFLTVNCQPVCAEGLTRGCTEAATPTGYTDQIRSADPYRFTGPNTNAASVYS